MNSAMDRVAVVFVALIQVSLSLWRCSGDLDCSVQVGSECVDGFCRCPPGQEPVFGGTQCVGIAPYYSSPCHEDHQCSRLWVNYECRRSENSTVGTCECKEGNHYFLGRCWRSREFREVCDRDEECITIPRDPYALKCDGVCVCSDGYYERQRGECRQIGKAEGDGCVVNEDCQFTGGICDIGSLACIGTAKSNEPTSFQPISVNSALSDREIDSVHNRTCSSDFDCDEPAQCTSGVCVCPSGFYRYNDKCYAEIGTPSTLDQCDGLITVVIDGICTCPANFFFDKNMRDCVRVTRRITDSCVADDNCHTFGAQARCGAPTEPWGLRTCECITENAVWNENSYMCRLFASVGEQCEEDSDCLAGELEITCVKDEQDEGYCRCPPHLTEMDGLCLSSGLVLGDSCQATPECTGTDNTVCTNGKCGCADGFQQQGDACAPVIGGSCSVDSDCIIENTVCRDTADGHTCQCPDHLVEYDQRCFTISPGFNASCEVSVQCQASMGEAGGCVDGLCSCLTNHHFRDGRCWRITELFQPCSRTSECYLRDTSDMVVCRNGRCQCDFDYPYSEELMTCASSATTLLASLGTIFALYILIN